MRSTSQRRPTVTDVAKVAKVGASTVSRYLRGINIRPSAAQRVSAAIEKLGYTPDEAARALRGGSTRTIGIVVPQVDNTFFSKAIQAIESEAHRRGFSIILQLHEEDPERQLQQLATLRRYRTDGVILSLAPRSKPTEIAQILAEIPTIAFDRNISDEFDSVTLRNREAGRAATDHLLRHGYTGIACVTARTELFTFKERIQGYMDAMQSAGHKPHVMEAKDYNELRLMLASALSTKKHPEALLADGARLPLIGFDDFDFAPLMNPALTVMRQPVELMVRYALDLLFRKIDARAKVISPNEASYEAQTITLAGELVCRRSCGCG